MTPSGPWGDIFVLDTNGRHEIMIDDKVELVASVYVREGTDDHLPKDPPPDEKIASGESVRLTQDGEYVIQIGESTTKRITIVVDTDLGPLPDYVAEHA
jgi:hypothetical protein